LPYGTLSQTLEYFATARRSSVDNTRDGRRSADDLGQRITSNAYVCIQHDAPEAARRAGPSATADILVYSQAIVGDWASQQRQRSRPMSAMAGSRPCRPAGARSRDTFPLSRAADGPSGPASSMEVASVSAFIGKHSRFANRTEHSMLVFVVEMLHVVADHFSGPGRANTPVCRSVCVRVSGE